jgi:hypothetical protein
MLETKDIESSIETLRERGVRFRSKILGVAIELFEPTRSEAASDRSGDEETGHDYRTP